MLHNNCDGRQDDKGMKTMCESAGGKGDIYFFTEKDDTLICKLTSQVLVEE
jgi:hypothetical protein